MLRLAASLGQRFNMHAGGVLRPNSFDGYVDLRRDRLWNAKGPSFHGFNRQPTINAVKRPKSTVTSRRHL